MTVKNNVFFVNYRREAHGEVRPRNNKNNHERIAVRDTQVVVVEQVDNESAGESDTKGKYKIITPKFKY